MLHFRCLLAATIGCTLVQWACLAESPAWHEAFASRVYEARQSGAPMPQLSAVRPDATLADGYGVQAVLVQKIMASDAIGGYKSALVSAAAQSGMKLDGPLVGVLPKSGILHARDGIVINLAEDPVRHLETEIGFRFGTAITEAVPDVAALKGHVSHVVAILEIPGGATENKGPTSSADLLAWNINAKAVALGELHEPDTVAVDDVQITLTHNGTTINTAEGSQAAGGQWATLLKSVNTLVAQGYTIAEGHVISNGALGKIVRLEPGTYHADFSALGEIAITVRDE